jgi:hypothetical protein
LDFRELLFRQQALFDIFVDHQDGDQTLELKHERLQLKLQHLHQYHLKLQRGLLQG